MSSSISSLWLGPKSSSQSMAVRGKKPVVGMSSPRTHIQPSPPTKPLGSRDSPFEAAIHTPHRAYTRGAGSKSIAAQLSNPHQHSIKDRDESTVNVCWPALFPKRKFTKKPVDQSCTAFADHCARLNKDPYSGETKKHHLGSEFVVPEGIKTPNERQPAVITPRMLRNPTLVETHATQEFFTTGRVSPPISDGGQSSRGVSPRGFGSRPPNSPRTTTSTNPPMSPVQQGWDDLAGTQTSVGSKNSLAGGGGKKGSKVVANGVPIPPLASLPRGAPTTHHGPSSSRVGSARSVRSMRQGIATPGMHSQRSQQMSPHHRKIRALTKELPRYDEIKSIYVKSMGESIEQDQATDRARQKAFEKEMISREAVLQALGEFETSRFFSENKALGAAAINASRSNFS